MLIVFFSRFFPPAEWIAAGSHLHTALQVAAVLVLPGILCPSGCWQGGKGSMCMVISAVYNDRQLRGGASGRMSALQHASSVFFQTLYRCTMYTCIFIINIYIFNSYYIYIYIHTHFLIGKSNQPESFLHWGFHRLRSQWQRWTWIKRLRVLSLAMFGTRLPPNSMAYVIY